MAWYYCLPGALYLLIGLALIAYYDRRGWPDAGQAMPGCSCLIGIIFFPSALILFAVRWIMRKTNDIFGDID